MRGLSLVVASGGHSSSRCVGLSLSRPLIAGHRLQTRRLSRCGSRVQLLRGMWDPPTPGLEPVCPALAGRFSTTAPPGKPHFLVSKWKTGRLRGKGQHLTMVSLSITHDGVNQTLCVFWCDTTPMMYSSQKVLPESIKPLDIMSSLQEIRGIEKYLKTTWRKQMDKSTDWDLLQDKWTNLSNKLVLLNWKANRRDGGRYTRLKVT